MRHQRPPSFDYNLVVIGAGSAGLVAALVATSVRAKVALVEQGPMGGECLNSGCVPSKALLRCAKLLHDSRRAAEFGLGRVHIDYDFAGVMERVQRVIAKVAPNDSIERYSALGVECIQGRARIRDPWCVEVGERRLSTRNIIIATGSRPSIPDLPGLQQCAPLSSETLWSLRERPRNLLVLGGGAMGCELAQAFARLDCKVTLVARSSTLLPREDPEVGTLLGEVLERERVRVLTGHTALRIEPEPDQGFRLVCRAPDGDDHRIRFDRLLLATGRRPNTGGLGLEDLGIRLDPDGTPLCNRFLQTNLPNIYCAGDLIGPYRYTHSASHQAWHASVNALFGGIKRFKVDYRAIPWVTFTDPEIARVGLSETQARAQRIAFEISRHPVARTDRAITDGLGDGFIQVLTPPGKDRILGVTLVAAHAGDLLPEFVLAMKQGIGLKKLLATVHSYPTLAEGNRAVAAEWRRKHAPAGLLKWMERLHRWLR